MKTICTVVIFTTLWHGFQTETDELKLVVALFRHGDRTPARLATYPKNPYANLTYSPYGRGELTDHGRTRAYLLGNTLRTMYNKYLDGVEVKAVSTDFNRTKDSLYLVLNGLFDDNHNFNRSHPLKHFNLEITPVQNNRLLSFPFFYCPRYQEIYKQYETSEEGRKLLKKYAAKFSYIYKHTGVNITNLWQLLPIFESIKSNKEWGIKIPTWAKPVYQYLMSAGEDFYMSTVALPGLNKLFGGVLLNEILRNIGTDIETKRLFLYSAHDLNLFGLLGAMELHWPHIPHYTACIIIELHQIGHIPYVKVLYQADYSKGFKEMKLPECDVLCPLEKFKNTVYRNIPGDNDTC
ncbi:venom acid phosphatase Acph-1-like [Photinus pyralis]|uniref:venom acid phosphatase Acph-1-like n=1 Tax=Photinus pyralis TaxID=7054 RepID=UPI0012677D5D|nr:venom acid phosphatase Acph-1-like [Photinus pyralis]